MIFDVMIKSGENENGKQIVQVYRVHDLRLSEYLRNVQDVGHYIIAVIPLFRNKIQKEKGYSDNDLAIGGYSQEKLDEIRQQYDPIDPRLLVDPFRYE